jgi:threonine/homoserine/homoserine lactone efflux protein
MSALYLLAVATGVHGAKMVLRRRTIRRALDAITGAALIGFSARVASERI